MSAPLDECRVDIAKPSIGFKLQQMRQQFYNGSEVSRAFGHHSGLKRSSTNRVSRESGDCSLDSGLSSPGSRLSSEDTVGGSHQPAQLRRHFSMDCTANAYQNKHLKQRSIIELEKEAGLVQQIVDDLASTKTMKRRRHKSANMTIFDRRRRATESLSSYVPTAPVESEWGAMFDEMVARLKGLEIPADEAHICDRTDCNSNCKMAPSEAEDSVTEREQLPDEVFDYKPVEPQLEGTEELTVSNHKQIANVTRQTSLPMKKSRSLDMRSLMRSISFHRPDIAMYNMPLASIRRTDSDNDVWVERSAPINSCPQSPNGSTPTQLHRKGSKSTWQKLTRFFSFNHKPRA